MKIDSHAVKTSSSYSCEKTEVSFTKFVGNSAITPAQARAAEEAEEAKREDAPATLSLSDAAKKSIEDWKEKQQQANNLIKTKMGNAYSRVPSNPEEVKMTLLDYMLSALTGKKITSKLINMNFESRSFDFMALSGNMGGVQNGAGLRNMNFTTETMRSESESVTYTAQGIINTADGRQITVDINMSMAREMVSYERMDFSVAANICDPLIINYAGTAASLTDEKYDFDLNVDGELNQISFAGPGQGFLALDKNGDGIINDGSELFGPDSGNGFDDLRAYDRDRNGWIDDNDDVFDKLIVWSKDADGNDQFFTLRELGIGAIYLGETDTRFGFHDSGGSSQGMMQSTSFFLTEIGGAGTISHVDLAI